jgi:hypothetical protein
LYVGITLVCAGLVLALGGFEIGRDRDTPQVDSVQEDNPRYTDVMVIYIWQTTI